jgi:transposase
VGKYVFIDEMGSHLGLTRLYGRAAPGQRVYDEVPGDRGGNVSTIGALGVNGIRTGLSVPGPIDGDTMLFFVEELLVPTLKRGDIVVMDNNPINKLDEIEDAIEAVGAGVLFLPTYSPDLNPIEHCWSKVKTRLRALKPRTLPDLLEALVTAFASITTADIRGGVSTVGIGSHPLENRYKSCTVLTIATSTINETDTRCSRK